MLEGRYIQGVLLIKIQVYQLFFIKLQECINQSILFFDLVKLNYNILISRSQPNFLQKVFGELFKVYLYGSEKTIVLSVKTLRRGLFHFDVYACNTRKMTSTSQILMLRLSEFFLIFSLAESAFFQTKIQNTYIFITFTYFQAWLFQK